MPKLFISYSWSNPDHEVRVLQLATELRDNGVDVILDKWDLREGQDANGFMESMVNDPDVQKVLLVCDRIYVEKANNRKGGAGTEAQIISPEIYSGQKQSKFVALVLERDEQGLPLVPHYYRSRIHIDFSDPSNSATSFEQLLRWAHDRPLHEKPPLGKVPTFLDDTSKQVALGVATRHRHALQAIQDGRPNAGPVLTDYLGTLGGELEKLRIGRGEGEFDDAVVASIADFLPYRNQLIQVLDLLALHQPGMETAKITHRFLEQLLPYIERPPTINTWRETDFDNFRFLVHEVFLYTIAILLRRERFAEATHLLEADYYWPNNPLNGNMDVVDYTWFRQHVASLKARSDRLNLGRLSLHADLLKERCVELPVTFTHLAQADFVLFLRAAIASGQVWGGWWPETLVYYCRFAARFEIFARARSKDYFLKLVPLLGISNLDGLKSVVDDFKKNGRRVPRWDFEGLDIPRLIGVDELATRP